eukprot:8303_1
MNDLEFEIFLPTCITIIEEAIILQLINKAIKAIYRSSSSNTHLCIVRYTSWSCGGSTLNREFKYYKKYKNGALLPGLKRLTAKPKDKRIPMRIIDEMQTRTFQIMNPDLEHITNSILHQLQSELCMLIRLTSKPKKMVDKIIKNILKREDLREQLHALYNDWALNKITNFSKRQLQNINLEKRNLING